MTAKLIALAATLAALIPQHATVYGVCVQIHAAMLIILLVACMGLGMAAWRAVGSFRSSPYMRRGTRWSYA